MDTKNRLEERDGNINRDKEKMKNKNKNKREWQKESKNIVISWFRKRQYKYALRYLTDINNLLKNSPTFKP